jgi:hypothetical protein
VRYGDAAREEAIGEVLWQIERACERNGVGTAAQKLVNSILRVPLSLSRLALVKKTTYESEREWRITIAEHFGSSSLSMKLHYRRSKSIPTMRRARSRLSMSVFGRAVEPGSNHKPPSHSNSRRS